MKIFISYRRDDSAGYAGRLFDYLVEHFGQENVFMDVATIRPGQDFRKALTNAVGQCDVVLVMIGKQWLNIEDSQGRRRLDDPEDWVRTEIAAALVNPEVHVIPVLVRDAYMPQKQQLPEDLQDLAWRNAIELTDARFPHDASQLITEIERVIEKDEVTPVDTAPWRLKKPARQGQPPSRRWAMIAILILGILAIARVYSQMAGQFSRATPAAATKETISTAIETTSTPFPRGTPTVTPPLVLFEETFEDNQHDWPIHEYDDASIQYGKLNYSHYCSTIASNGCAYALKVPFNFPTNFRLEMDVKIVDQPAKLWIGFRVRQKGKDYYYLEYDFRGDTESLWASYNEGQYRLISQGVEEIMNRGRGLTNRLGIELKDAVITPLLNKGRLEKKKDDHLSVAGDSYLVIRVTGSDPSRPTTIEIDNLKVEEIK